MGRTGGLHLLSLIGLVAASVGGCDCLLSFTQVGALAAERSELLWNLELIELRLEALRDEHLESADRLEQNRRHMEVVRVRNRMARLTLGLADEASIRAALERVLEGSLFRVEHRDGALWFEAMGVGPSRVPTHYVDGLQDRFAAIQIDSLKISEADWRIQGRVYSCGEIPPPSEPEFPPELPKPSSLEGEEGSRIRASIGELIDEIEPLRLAAEDLVMQLPILQVQTEILVEREETLKKDAALRRRLFEVLLLGEDSFFLNGVLEQGADEWAAQGPSRAESEDRPFEIDLPDPYDIGMFRSNGDRVRLNVRPGARWGICFH